METFMAVLMALGIYLGVPLIIGLAIAGIFIMADQKIKRAKQTKSLEEAVEDLERVVAEAKSEEHARTVTH